MALAGQCLPLDEVLKSDFLTCGICMNVYEKPKILPCLHTYCEKCLDSLVVYQGHTPVKITCPECRDTSDLPASGVRGLRTCFFISGLIDLYHTKAARGQLCSVCLETKKTTIPAVAHCIDCADNLCSICSSGHCCSRLTTHHRVVDLDDLSVGKFDQDLRIRQKMFCSLHSTEELRFYCESCKMAICRDCRLLCHIEHTCTSISDAVSSAVTKVNDRIGDLETQASSIVAYRENLQSKIVQIRDCRKAGLAQIDNITQRITSSLHQESQEAKMILCKKIDGQEKPLLTELHEFQTKEALVQSCLTFSSHTLKNARDAEILSLSDLLYTRIQKLNSEETAPSSLPFHGKEWVVSCRVCPESVLESLFDVVQASQDSPNHAELETVPSTQFIPTFKFCQDSSWAGEKFKVATVFDKVPHLQRGQDQPRLTSRTISEPALYSHVHEIPTSSTRPNWVMEKTLKLKLKDDIMTPYVAGMVINCEDSLFVTDINNQTVKMASNTGQFIKTVTDLDGERGLSGLANSGDEVICSSKSRVFRISKKGEHVGDDILIPRKSNCNPNIAVYEDYIAIAEGNFESVSLYQITGHLIRRLKMPTADLDSTPSRPVFVAFNTRGHLVVSDWTRNEVVILTLNGNLVRRFSFDQKYQPCCVCVDRDGQTFLSCFGSKDILCLKDEDASWTPAFSLKCGVIPSCPMVIAAGNQGRLYVSVGGGLLRIYRKT